jgi:hypothetical protein
VPVAAHTTVRDLPAQLLSTMETGAVTYRLSGVERLESMPFSLPFSRAGRLSLLQAGDDYADETAVAGTRCQSTPPLVEPIQ